MAHIKYVAMIYFVSTVFTKCPPREWQVISQFHFLNGHISKGLSPSELKSQQKFALSRKFFFPCGFLHFKSFCLETTSFAKRLSNLSTPEMYLECVIASWEALILLLDAENIERRVQSDTEKKSNVNANYKHQEKTASHDMQIHVQ